MRKITLRSRINFSLVIYFVLVFTKTCIASNPLEQTTLLFENFTIDDGLSQSSITCILQDRKGFLWIGSGNGLNRYDGRSFKVFYPQSGDSLSLSNSEILKLFEDSEGYIWVGTAHGLNRFDWHMESFRRFMANPDDSTALSDNFIQSLTEDKNGNIWIGTQNGLNCYDKTNDRFTRYFFQKINTGVIGKRTTILSLFCDDQNNLWIGTYHGLIKFNLNTKQFENFYPDLHDTTNSELNKIFVIDQDEDNNIWIGTGDGVFKLTPKKEFIHYPLKDKNMKAVTVFDLLITSHSGIWIGSYGAGLFQLDPVTGETKQWKNNPYEKSSLLYDNVFDLAKDRSGIIWIATGLGLSKLDLQNSQFRTYLHYPGCENCLSDNIIWAIFEDHNGVFWFGTDRYGLDYYNPKTKQFKTFHINKKSQKSLEMPSILSIAEDKDGKLWIATQNDGLYVLDQNRKKIRSYHNKENDSKSISSDVLQTIFIDKKNRIWIGSAEGVLNLYNREKDNFIRYSISGYPNGIELWNSIWAIVEDANGNLLIGTETAGLFLLNLKTNQVEHLSSSPDLKKMEIFSIMSIYSEDISETIWLGTGGQGLIKYEPLKGKVRRFTCSDGLPTEMIYGILPERDSVSDQLKALWLSTDKGLVRFDLASKTMKVYDTGNGLPANEFNSGAYFKSKSGEMYFGSINGVVYFDPEQIQQDTFCPPVTLTSFSLFNKPVKIATGKEAILKKSITETKEIILNYDQNIFAIGFSMLHFRNPKQQKYQYKMAGLDDRWVDLGNKRHFTFTHLPPGKYEFKVRGRNGDGVWSKKITTLKIHIIPPFWQRLHVQILAGVMLLSLLIGYHKYRTGLVKRRNRQLRNLNEMLNREIDDRKKAQEKIAASLEEKEILLKEIHHRVKNNLQVTSSLLYLQSENIKDEKAKNYLQESQNRIKSMAMIHEKLYRSENFAHINSRDYIHDLAMHVFRSYAAHRQKISLNVHVEPVDFDLDTAIPCGLILNELISNSIKYAFSDGKTGEIYVSLREKAPGTVELSVKDNGTGVSDGFDLEHSNSLGLQLVKSLVNQLEGKLEFKSNSGVGCYYFSNERI